MAVQNEFLSHHRQINLRSNLPEKVQVTLKELFICQYAQALGSRSFVGPGNADGIEIFANDAR